MTSLQERDEEYLQVKKVSRMFCVGSNGGRLGLEYLQGRDMHDPSKRGLKHHGNTRADGDHDHHPVQIGYQAQQITGEHTDTHTCKV